MAIKRRNPAEEPELVADKQVEQMVIDQAIDMNIRINPDSIYKTQDKISNMLPQIFDKGEQLLTTDTKQQTFTRVNISYEGLLNIDSSFTSFDSAVLSGVLSCVLQNMDIQTNELKYFSIGELYRAITGKTSESGISPNQIRKIIASIKKLSYTEVQIDLTNEADKYNFALKPEELVISGPLIALETIRAKINGKMVLCFKPLSVPLLYRYALPKHQLYSHDIALMRIDTISKSENVISMLDYLLKYISYLFYQQKNKKFVNNGLLFDTIYGLTDIAEFTNQNTIKSKKKRLKAELYKILDFWVDLGHLTSYEVVKRGKVDYKIIIHVNPNSPYPPKIV